jgi:hypothetical protein
MIDLFGEDSPIIDKKQDGHLSNYQRAKLRFMYRKADSENKCGTCQNLIIHEYHDHNYFKCALIGRSFGSATDVRKSWTCERFTKRFTNIKTEIFI